MKTGLGLGLDVGMVEVRLTMPQLRLTIGEKGMELGLGLDGLLRWWRGLTMSQLRLTIGEDGMGLDVGMGLTMPQLRLNVGDRVGAGAGDGDGGGGVDYATAEVDY